MLKLIMTCTSCPEQYEAYLDNKQVGYLRLRHGCFRAQVPDSNGEVVYSTEDIVGDGSFIDEHERDLHLTRASEAILAANGVKVYSILRPRGRVSH